MTRALAVALAPHRIRVNAIAFGSVMSASLKDALDGNNGMRNEIISSTPLGRIASPIELVEVAQFLASDGSDFVTGQILTGGWRKNSRGTAPTPRHTDATRPRTTPNSTVSNSLEVPVTGHPSRKLIKACHAIGLPSPDRAIVAEILRKAIWHIVLRCLPPVRRSLTILQAESNELPRARMVGRASSKNHWRRLTNGSTLRRNVVTHLRLLKQVRKSFLFYCRWLHAISQVVFRK